ncbi:hypothetical protein OKA04_12415 [Luteolibacter flavescens]|uniref:DUF2489 domain-containing protein n=1 Tax=Luteolibacter flavescens TaxID=1859460 RepID=A0ABT3FRE2_9BACT|nr:hypothetical protein [Luteolibacter flavescens]MCW1885535.1 hypothetical protein [Luteolibacter flavescens]
MALLILGAVVAHWLTRDREEKAKSALLEREAELRRRSFRKLARVWRYTLERLPNNNASVVWEAYEKMAVEILAEGDLSAPDFKRHDDLMAAIKTAGEIRKRDAEAEAQQNCCSLRELLRDKVKAIQEIADQG